MRRANGGGEGAAAGILAEIALDLYVLRLITPVQTFFQNAVNGLSTTQEDIDVAIQLVDEWGRGFVAETDYRLEAKNTQEFGASMKARGLEAVCAPAVVEELVRDTVLVTEWVERTRHDRDASPDVPRLCGVAINAYLTMLLDTGVLHCDPHPGNLLRSKEGKLVILDWGMTSPCRPTSSTPSEFIAHLNVETDRAAGLCEQDFARRRRCRPPEAIGDHRRPVCLPPAQRGRWAEDRGARRGRAEGRYGTELSGRELEKKAQEEFVSMAEAQLAAEGVDVKGVTNVMEEMSRRNRELFALPPWVLYVARAFSTLEGIGLSIDEDYAIVQECYPYLARRLFTDRSPRAKTALRAMLGLDGVVAPTASAGGTMDGLLPALPAAGGAMDGVVVPTAAAGGGLSPAKLVEMSEQFRTATAAPTTSTPAPGSGGGARAREATGGTRGIDAAGHPRRRGAKLGDATVRSALRAALIDAPSTLAAPLGLAPPAALALLAPSKDDEAILARAAELRDLVAPQGLEAPSATASTAPRRRSPPPSPSRSLLLSDEAARDDAIQGIEGLGVLTRRVGAEMLRRSATRFDAASELPAAARDAARDANVALAEALDPPAAD